MFNEISVNNTSRVVNEINEFLKDKDIKVAPLFIDKLEKSKIK